MSHLHHLIPKHAGGTDDPNNLCRLSIDEHAKAHQSLYEQYGRWQDYVAWQGLAKLIDKEELIKTIQSNAARDRLIKHGNPFKGIRTKSNFGDNNELQHTAIKLARTPTAIEKRRKTFITIKHQQQNNNSQFGTVWCVHQDSTDLVNRKKYHVGKIPFDWITTTEWTERRKNKKSNAYGRHWYNDGHCNFYLKPLDSKVNELNLIRGRLIK